MADDPLAPESAPESLVRLPVGQLGLNPYAELFAGLTPEQIQAYDLLTDPMFQYTAFGLPPGPANPYPGLFPRPLLIHSPS
jgi:hypothetical protein